MFDSNIIEKFKTIETPFYYYDLDILEKNLQTLRQISNSYNYQVHYALKANFNRPILELIAKYGFGADCVSGNEIKQALESGFIGVALGPRVLRTESAAIASLTAIQALWGDLA